MSLLPGQTRFSCQAGCHEEYLALSVSQKKSKWKQKCQRTREQVPGVPLVIVNINISHAVVLFKLTQDREVVVNNLKMNTEQMSPCPLISSRKVYTTGITSLLYTFGGGGGTEVWRPKGNLYSQRMKGGALLLINFIEVDLGNSAIDSIYGSP